MRQFFAFCLERRWIEHNPAKKIKAPRNIRPEEVVPYTSAETAKILAACDEIGRTSYERLRARAMVLLMRYAGLRISDVATLERSRVAGGQILLHTQKTGGMVFLPIPAELQSALDKLPIPRGIVAESRCYFLNGITFSRRALVGIAERAMAAVFKKSKVQGEYTPTDSAIPWQPKFSPAAAASRTWLIFSGSARQWFGSTTPSGRRSASSASPDYSRPFSLVHTWYTRKGPAVN